MKTTLMVWQDKINKDVVLHILESKHSYGWHDNKMNKYNYENVVCIYYM
jgi:hypothetical protein